jgi:hypothetical protein
MRVGDAFGIGLLREQGRFGLPKNNELRTLAFLPRIASLQNGYLNYGSFVGTRLNQVIWERS